MQTSGAVIEPANFQGIKMLARALLPLLLFWFPATHGYHLVWQMLSCSHMWVASVCCRQLGMTSRLLTYCVQITKPSCSELCLPLAGSEDCPGEWGEWQPCTDGWKLRLFIAKQKDCDIQVFGMTGYYSMTHMHVVARDLVPIPASLRHLPTLLKNPGYGGKM